MAHENLPAARRAAPMPAAVGQLRRQVFHRVALGRLDVMVGIADDAVLGHPDGAQRAIAVLTAPEPDRIAGRPDDHALMDIE